MCLCYNSKNEIINAFEMTAEQVAAKKIEKVTIEDFDANLYGGANCKPDILIRTSNEIRLSNFLLHQTD